MKPNRKFELVSSVDFSDLDPIGGFFAKCLMIGSPRQLEIVRLSHLKKARDIIKKWKNEKQANID